MDDILLMASPFVGAVVFAPFRLARLCANRSTMQNKIRIATKNCYDREYNLAEAWEGAAAPK
jgi:hypothetical protein